jgi:S1-C subfamily serine protease
MQQLGEAQAHIATKVQKSLVTVSNDGRSGGAGVVWSAAGLILTNAHVIRRQAPQVELHDGQRYESRIVARDPQRDLAFLQISFADLEPLVRGQSKALRPGDWVLSIGHPWGVRGAASAGSVIAVGQPAEQIGRYRGDLIQVGLHLRPGHSGGPMVNASGEWVGLNTMIAGPNVGLAVPIHVIETFAQEYLSEQDVGFI